MRKNAEGTQVNSRRVRKYMVAPVTRAIRAALAVSAATLAFGGQALAADANATGHAPARNEAAQRDAVGAPVLDLTLAGGPAPTSVIPGMGAGTGLPTPAPRGLDDLATASRGDFAVANGHSGLDVIDDPTIPAADFIYTNVGAIVVVEAASPAIGIYGNAGVDDVVIVNDGSIDVYSALNIADGIFAGGNDIDVTNNGTILADGSGFAAGIEAQGTGLVVVDNTNSIGVFAYGSLATAYGIYATGDMVDVTNSGVINATGEMPTGILATGGTSASVDNSGDIFVGTPGGTYAGTGILVSSLYDGSTASVVNSGLLAAYGYYGATGIEVRASGAGSTGTVENSGVVFAAQTSKYGNGAAGIVVASEGSSIVDNSGTVLVESGGQADGIIALAFNGDASVTNSGNVLVVSDDSIKYYTATGITAASQYGMATVDNSGSVDVSSTKYGGYIATGIVASGGAGSSVINSGSIRVVGYSAYGVIASSTDGDVTIDQADTGITLVGGMTGSSTAIGFAAISTQGNVSVNNAGVVYGGSYGLAIGVYATSAYGDVQIGNTGSIYGYSDGGNAFGIAAIAGGAVSIDNQGDIVALTYTAGPATGILAQGDTVTIDNAGQVTAVGYGNVVGIQASGLTSVDINSSGDITAAALDTTAGTAFGIYAVSPGDVNVGFGGNMVVSAIADPAIGIFAYSSGGNVSVDNSGNIDVYSEYGLADGIFASGLDVAVSNSGGILVDGADWAAGIEAQGSGAVSVTNSGDISVNVHFDTGTEFYGYHYSFGIFATGDQVTIDNSGTIAATGDMSNGIYAIGGSSVSVTNSGDIDSGTLLNTYAGMGIFVASLYDGSTASVANSGNISVEGYFGAVGIEVRATGVGSSASASNSGAIYASQYSKYGSGAAGIVVASEGDASVDNSGIIDITSYGQADGIIAIAVNGNASVTNSGDIDVLSDGSSLYYSANGITAASQFGTATVDNSGSVFATSTKYGGYIATGILASGGDGATVMNSGDVTAIAKYSYGIVATSANGDVLVDQSATGSVIAGNLDSTGAYGIIGIAATGDATINTAGSVDATAYSTAIGIYAGAAYGVATVNNSGSVTAYSFADSATGIVAVGDDVQVSNSGVVDANGLLTTAGILALGDTVSVDNTGSIVALGYSNVFGIRAQGATSVDVTGNGDITVTGVGATAAAVYGIHAVSAGDVSVDFGGNMYVDSITGLAIGIFAYSTGGDVDVSNSGLIDVYSDEALADGIFASGVNVNVDNSGTVIVDGESWAAGIEAQGTDLTTVTNSGDITVDVHINSGYYNENYSFGIFATGDVVEVGNSGGINVTGDLANGIYAIGGSSVSIDNTGTIDVGDFNRTYAGNGIFAASLYDASTVDIANSGSINARGYFGAVGIEARATGVGSIASVDNSGTIYAGAYSKYGNGGSGIVAAGEGGSVVVNSGSIEVIAGGLANGILAIAINGDAMVTNSGDIDVLSNAASKYYGAYGIAAASTNGQAIVNNTGSIYSASTKYGGYIAMGILATGGDGVAVTNSGTIGALGNNGYGIVGTSVDGDVSIVQTGTGAISVINAAGSYSIGALGISTNGDVNISNAGSVDLQAYYGSLGLFARSTNGDVWVSNSGDVSAEALVRAIGINASAANGTATVNNTGSIYAGSPLLNLYYYTSATGIDARGDVVAVNNSGDIEAVSYDTAIGVLAIGTTGVSITNSGEIVAYSPYDLAVGVYAVSGGDASIWNSGSITADSVGPARGIFAYAGNDFSFSNSGAIEASSSSADAAMDTAIGVQLLVAGNVEGSNSGTISAVSTDVGGAVGLQITSNGTVDFLNSGTISATHATYAVAVDLNSSLAVFENTGTLMTDTALAGQVAVRGGAGAQVIINRGDIIGALVLGGGTDIFAGYSGGEWLVNNATTDFGGGDDRLYNFSGSLIHLQDGSIYMGAGVNNMFENSGTIRVSGTGLIDMGNGLLLPVGPDAPAAVPSLNALPFVNDGLITFLDGAPDDMLTVVGDFSGDGMINIDIGILAGLGDMLYVDGSVVNGGSQTVNADFDGRVTDLLDPVTFAVVTGNTINNAFVGGQALGPDTESDFLDYELVVTSAVVGGDTEYMLGVDITGLNAAGSLAAAIAPGAHSLINSHVGTWRQRMGVMPDKDGLNGLGPWVRVWRDSGSIDVAHSESFGAGGTYRFDQDNDGREVGFNFDSGFGLSWGVMLGSADGTQDLDGSIGRNRIDMDSAGLYATWIGEHLYADVSWRGISFDADLRTAGGTFLSTHGDATAFSVEAGWRGLQFGSVDVVPQLQYTRAEITNIDDVVGGSSSFEYDPGSSERLRVGVGFSRTFDSGSVLWTPYGSLNAVREFEGNNGYTAADFHTGTTTTEGTSAMVELGVGAQLGGWSLTAGASWTDGGAQESFVGGQMILRFTW